MNDFTTALSKLVEEAKALHGGERRATIRSVLLIGRLEANYAATVMCMSRAQFAAYVGLTPDVYAKRAQAARVLAFFPKMRALLDSGEIEVAHLTMLAPKITQANEDVVIEGIRGKSKREAQAFLSRVTCDGELLDKEEEIELRVTLTKSELELLDRAREVLSHGGHVPALKEIMVKAMKDLLAKRDPIVVAKRAEERKQRSQKADAPAHAEQAPAAYAPAQTAEGSCPTHAMIDPMNTPRRRRAIPRAVRHAVMLRDGGRCTWEFSDGSRCVERGMLELDHRLMHCWGGGDAVEDLATMCRLHNRLAAELCLGRAFVAGKIAEARH